MYQPQATLTGTVERLPLSISSSVVASELNKIASLLRSVCPPDAHISFDFDGKLYVHIDVRKQEEVTLAQAMLPALGMGLFDNISLGRTPNRPFFHRITAVVGD